MSSLQINSIGRTIKGYRERRKLGQSEVAGQAGISVSMLSQIENGRVSPSIDTLLRVCTAVGLEPMELFRHVAPLRPVRIMRREQRLRTDSKGALYEQLVASPDTGYPAELFLLEVEVGRKVGLGGMGHEGVELGYVLEGEAEMTVGGEQHCVREGDSLSFSAHLPHSLKNDSGRTFRAIWTVIPPHKDYLELEMEKGDSQPLPDKASR